MNSLQKYMVFTLIMVLFVFTACSREKEAETPVQPLQESAVVEE